MTTQRRRPKLIDPMQRVQEYPLRRLGMATQHDLVGTDRSIATRTQQVSDDAVRGHLNSIRAVTFVLSDATAGATTIPLPAAATVEGERWTVKKTDASANSVTVDPSGAETIDGAGSYGIAVQYGAVTIQAHSGAWYIVAEVV